MFLLDTNVVSVLRKPYRAPLVEQWLVGQRRHLMYLSVVTFGEIEKGIAHQRRRDSAYADVLAGWRDRVVAEFDGRILQLTLPITRRWGALVQRRPDDIVDMMLAATALEHDLVLVTRNVGDFAGIDGLRLENPFVT
jgi:predicted nucleic acid-binding protein